MTSNLLPSRGVAGESTRFGLKESLGAKWKRLQELESHGDFSSTYSASFK